MLRGLLFFGLGSLLLLGSTAIVQSQGGKGQTDKPLSMDVTFSNGSRLVVTLMNADVEVVTDFGKLVVPFNKIRAIEFGQRIETEEAEKIQQLVTQLSSDQYRKREEAYRDLVNFKEKSYPYLQRAKKSTTDQESVARIEKALQAIESKTNEFLLQRKEQDVIRTENFIIVGKILTPVMKAKADIFGEVQLKTSLMLAMQNASASSTNSSISLDAAKYGSLDEKWLETDVEVSKGLRISVKADGQVNMNPQGGGQPDFNSGPEGKFGMIYPKYQGWGQRLATPGSLIGKIGPNGQPFFIGTQYSDRVAQEGKLFLHVVPGPWGQPSMGSYRVRISSGFAPE